MSSTIIQDLPIEMIIEIFSYLSLRDLKDASLVCNDWYDALYHPKTLDRMILFLNKSNYCQYKTIMKKRNFHNIRFHQIDFRKNCKDIKLWQELGHNLQILIFRDCTITIKQLVDILETTKNLKGLNIEICNFADSINDTNVITDNFNSLRNILKNVKHFKFELLDRENIKLFNILFGMMPHLEFQEIDRFDWGTNDIVYNNLKSRASTLNRLCIYNSSPSEFFEDILKIENLKLKELNFNCEMTDTLLKSIISQQSITEIYIIGYISNSEIPIICNQMPNLEKFVFNFPDDKTNNAIKDLWKLKKLKYLEVNGYGLSGKDFLEGLKERNDNLQSLKLSYNENAENLLMHISNKFMHLRKLELRHVNGITENEIQNVCKNLVWLRDLNLHSSEMILSDFGLTGIKPEDQEAASQSEADAVLGFSIAHIKGLRSLAIIAKCCITVSTLREIASLKELVILRISEIKPKIDPDDVKILSNCKALERLDLSITDFKISKTEKKKLQKSFPRMKTLQFGCDHFYN